MTVKTEACPDCGSTDPIQHFYHKDPEQDVEGAFECPVCCHDIPLAFTVAEIEDALCHGYGIPPNQVWIDSFRKALGILEDP